MDAASIVEVAPYLASVSIAFIALLFIWLINK